MNAYWPFSFMVRSFPFYLKLDGYYDLCWLLSVQRWIAPTVAKRTWLPGQTSPGKSAVFPSIHLLHLLGITFGRKGFVLSCKLTQWYPASYEVRVPQTGSLPPASFRFCVAADTFVLS